MLNRIIPNLTKILGSRRLWRRFPFGSTALRVGYEIFSRPHFAHGVYAASDPARRLKIGKIRLVELGVAGRRGLLAPEAIAEEVNQALKIRMYVGFDTGTGMLASIDYRELRHVWVRAFSRWAKLRFEHL